MVSCWRQLEKGKKSESLLSRVHTQAGELITPLWSGVVKKIYIQNKTGAVCLQKPSPSELGQPLPPSPPLRTHKELNTCLSKGALLFVTLPHLRDLTGCGDADDRPSALWHHCQRQKSRATSTGACLGVFGAQYLYAQIITDVILQFAPEDEFKTPVSKIVTLQVSLARRFGIRGRVARQSMFDKLGMRLEKTAFDLQEL